MRTKALTTAALPGLALALGLVLSACGSSDASSSGSGAMHTSMTPSTTSSMTGDAMKTRTGEFMGENGKHVAGTVKVSDGEIVFSGFSSDEGPDLHVYLTNGAAESDIASGKEIDAITFDQASQTFKVGGVDVASYSTVVIHCDKANAVFGSAHLM